MSPNPYEPPARDTSRTRPFVSPTAAPTRTPFVLAAVGAWLAAGYWAVMTLVLAFNAAAKGNTFPAATIMPFLLIGLYIFRGLQLFKGDPAAARRILWLHCIGAFFALLQAGGSALIGATFVSALQGLKVAINVFGAITAYMALRAYAQAIASGAIPNRVGRT